VVAKAELEGLSAKIAAFRPDIVFLDGNYVPSVESLNPEFLSELKAKHGFKAIAFVGDAWGRHWLPAGDRWSEGCDIVYHCAPESPLESEGKHPEKLCWAGAPVNERSFFPDASKELDISFVGTYVSGLRPFWLTVALQISHRLRLKHRLLPHKREAGVALSMDRYAAVLRRSRMVLNFSTRLGPIKMMTGRSWQATTAGTVLLEEDNRFTSAYFVPFVHYVPFASRGELAYAIEFFSRNPAEAARIGEAASAFCRERYSAKEVWSQLIGAAYAGGGLRGPAVRHQNSS
jgi:Glycosyl transferases group 1